MRHARHTFLLVAAFGLTVAGCRGDFSDQPPIHLNPNMDNQERYDPQEPNPGYKDGRAMRKPVKGTVARNQLRTDKQLYLGKNKDGSFAEFFPADVKPTAALLDRGKTRYDVYCAPCHGPAGRGNGVIHQAQRGLPKPADFHDQRLRAMRLGEMVHTVTMGKGNMHRMDSMIPAADRWAIVAYLRALQLSQGAPDANREVTP